MKPKKSATSVRVTTYQLDRARAIARAMEMKISDYFNIALHDANKEYGRKFARKTRGS